MGSSKAQGFLTKTGRPLTNFCRSGTVELEQVQRLESPGRKEGGSFMEIVSEAQLAGHLIA